MTENSDLLLKMLVEQNKQNTELTRSIAVSVAEMSATVKHLEKRVDEVAPQVQRNIENAARTDEHFKEADDREKDNRANRAWYTSILSLILASAVAAWNMLRGGGP